MKIGIAKGRIEDLFYKKLVLLNILDVYDKNTRKLEQDIEDYKLYSLKSRDIVNLVDDGYLDLGIVGSDVIEEVGNNKIIELYDLKNGKCYFALASTPDKNMSDIKVIATKYPCIAKKILESNGMNVKIKKMNGSLELAPILGYADGIIDLVDTGNTLKANGLVELQRYDAISTRIISRVENMNKQKILEFIKRIGE